MKILVDWLYLRTHINLDILNTVQKQKKKFGHQTTPIFNQISIRNLIQKPDKKNNKASIIIISHKNLEKNYNNLLSNLAKNKFILKKPTFIRIDKV